MDDEFTRYRTAAHDRTNFPSTASAAQPYDQTSTGNPSAVPLPPIPSRRSTAFSHARPSRPPPVPATFPRYPSPLPYAVPLSPFSHLPVRHFEPALRCALPDRSSSHQPTLPNVTPSIAPVYDRDTADHDLVVARRRPVMRSFPSTSDQPPQ